MQATRTRFGRALAVLLILMMLVGIFPVGANAATADNVRHYDTYLCLGDSIAAGFGPYNREIKGLERIDVAYHAAVADAVTADAFYPLARTGMRSTEIRYMLDDSYAGDDFLFKIYKFPQELQDKMRPVYDEAVRTADLITLNCGSNDVLNYAYIRAYYAMHGESSEAMQYIMDVLENGGTIGGLIAQLFSTAETMGKLPFVAGEFITGLYQGYQNFKKNFDPLVKYIYDVNPDVTLVVVGMFNPMKNAKLTEISLMKVGRSFNMLARMMDQYMHYRSAYANKYLFADVWDTEVFEMPPMTDPNFQNDMMALVHPTLEGHQYMARQILSVLPERGTDPDPKPDPQPTPQPGGDTAKDFPFTDVTPDDWFYDNVYYVWDNGVMQGTGDNTFSPYGITTRAQFATVLYRMAGEPRVTSFDRARCGFTDLEEDAWYHDAVVWAASKGIVKGVSDTIFAPDAEITREQLVTMLWRYSREKAQNTDLSAFSDAADISDFAREAVAWAAENGIVNGTGDGAFLPQGSASRAELAAFLSRYLLR